MTEAQEPTILLSNRYLDSEGKPIPYGGGGDPMAGSGEFVDPAAPAPAVEGPIDSKQWGVEFKRLPVRMSLQMDLRWITHLIAECANQPLQVEVQEVRINPSDFATGGGMSSYGFGGGRGYEGGSSRGYEGGMGGIGASTANLFPERTGVQTFPAHPHVVNVVIQGVIYIFNEPDPATLQAGDEQLASNF